MTSSDAEGHGAGAGADSATDAGRGPAPTDPASTEPPPAAPPPAAPRPGVPHPPEPPADTHRPRAWRSPAAWTLLLLVIGIGLAVDFWSKSWTFEHVAGRPVVLDRASLLSNSGYTPIPAHEGMPVLPGGLLELRLVLNPGAVFGIGADKRLFFIVFTFAALVGGLFLFARMTNARHRLAHIGIGLILAGGLGNLYDRIYIGRVRDFLHMLPGWRLPFGMNWPGGSPEVFPWVFNIADVALLTGMALLMIHINRQEHKRKLRERSLTEAG